MTRRKRRNFPSTTTENGEVGGATIFVIDVEDYEKI